MVAMTLQKDVLISLAARLLEEGGGLSTDDSMIVARDLVAADMCGLYSHGVQRISFGVVNISLPKQMQGNNSNKTVDNNYAAYEVATQRWTTTLAAAVYGWRAA